MLPVRTAPLWRPGSRLLLAGRAYEAKSELHITLLSAAQLTALARAGLDPASLERLLAGLRFRFRWTGRLWLLSRSGDQGEERSLVQLVRQPDQERLRRRLARAAGLALGAPAPHVTLYTHRRPEGIGLPDRDAFRRLRIAPLDRSELLRLAEGTSPPCPR